MGYNAQSGRVGFKTQASKGVYADPGAVSPNKGVWMRLRSGSMGGNRDLLIPDPEIGGNRDVPDAQLGPINFPGEYDFYGRMESLATLFRAALGGTPASSGSGATGYTHVLGTGNVQPWLSVEEVIAGNYQQFKYTDVKVNTLHLEADANGYLMGSCGVVGLTQAALTTPTATNAQRWDTSPLVVGSNILFEFGGVQLPARSFSFDLTNNIEDDDFRLGSLFLGDAVEKRREITLGASIRPNDAALWKQAMWGSPVATVPLGMSYKDDVKVTIQTYEDIPGADPGVKYSLVLDLPQVIIAPFDMTPSGDDVITHDLEMRAVRPDPAVDIMTTTVKNSYATVA